MGWMADRYLSKIASAQTTPEAQDGKGTELHEAQAAIIETEPDTQNVSAVDSCSDDYWIPEDWQEDWEERAAIMEQDGGLPTEQAQAEAVISVVQVRHPEGEVAASWLREVQEVRQGRVPEWESWPKACRANWADQMLEMARAGDFLKFAGKGGRTWLEGLVQEQPTSQQVKNDAEPCGERQDGGRSPPANANHACLHGTAH